jgi:hypothetical protein
VTYTAFLKKIFQGPKIHHIISEFCLTGDGDC